MREIKFRGKEKCSGLWRCGFLLFDGEKYYIIQTIQGILVKWIVDTNTIGQFTGLFDKNGKEIYEGDIVRKRDLTFGLKYEGVVVYNSEIGAFRIHSENNGITTRIGFEISDVFNDGQCTIPIKYDYEVIGNIHDNKDL